MIPWLIAVLTLIPLYKVIFLYSRNLPQESWTTYFHFNNGIFSQSWLWFLPVLFLFHMLYLLISRIKRISFSFSLPKAIIITFLAGFVFSLFMYLLGARGWTKTIFIDFQNERLLIYFLIYLLGSLCYKLKTFETKPTNKKFYYIVNSTAWIPVNIYIFLLINSFLNPGNYIVSQLVDRIIILLSFHISMFSMLYAVVNTFRHYLNKKGKVLRVLNHNSYGVYIIHVIVMGGIALTMLNTAIPSLLKYLILTVSTYVASNLIIYFYRKVIKSKI